MFILVVTIHVIVSLIIIGLVLLQAGKGADIGSAFGGSGSQAVFGSMGTPTVLGKVTTVVAAVFMMTSFCLAIMSHRRAVSIMPASGPAAPAPATPARPALPRPSRRPLRPLRRSSRRPNAETSGARSLPAGLGRRRSARGGLQRADREPVGGRAGEGGAPAYGDTFIQASIGDIGGLIPNITTDQSSHEVGGMIYDGLVKLDQDLKMVPSMAESWTFSQDCLELTFKLRRDVKWHDGQPFTADDVLFTYQTMINPKTPAPFKDDFLLVKDVQAPDPYTVRVIYDKPYAQALETWNTYMLPKHLLQVVRGGGQAPGVAPEQPSGRHRPVPVPGVEERARRSCWSPTRTTSRAGRTSSRIVYRVIPSQATIFLELKAKGVDYAAASPPSSTRGRPSTPRSGRRTTSSATPGSGYTYFGFNLKDPRFADRRVRQAFAHAINKQELIDGVRAGPGPRGDRAVSARAPGPTPTT